MNNVCNTSSNIGSCLIGSIIEGRGTLESSENLRREIRRCTGRSNERKYAGGRKGLVVSRPGGV